VNKICLSCYAFGLYVLYEPSSRWQLIHAVYDVLELEIRKLSFAVESKSVTSVSVCLIGGGIPSTFWLFVKTSSWQRLSCFIRTERLCGTHSAAVSEPQCA
jgi:hypothetical protein